MIFEDAHWADPTSLELFGQGVNRIANIPVLLVITFRPEFEPPWIVQSHVTALTLNRLTRREIEAMINRVAGNKPMLANIRQEIIDRTDGIPLFVEEMTKAVLEAESQSATERTAGAIPSAAVAVPATLHASLMARLDRLGHGKEIAQVGAAIGREFYHPLLAAVVRKPEGELRSALDSLTKAGLLFRQGVPPHATYLFKHALVQDAAYGTLLREPRRALHACIAETLESKFPEIAESQPELLARHYTEAGLIEKAARLWGKAGLRSLERSAPMEAVEQLKRALAHLKTVPETSVSRREEIKIQAGLANGLMLTRGYAAPETRAAFEQTRLLLTRAEAFGEALEDPLMLFSTLYGFWVANFVAFNGDALRDIADQFLALAEKQKSTAPVMIGHRLVGGSLLHAGKFSEARAHLDRAFSIYDSVQHRQLAARFGHDMGVAILAWRSFALWLLGYPAAALVGIEEALQSAREIGQAGTVTYALFHALYVHVFCGEYARASAEIEEGMALADKKGLVFWKAVAPAARSWVFLLTNRISDAMQILNASMAAYRSTGATLFLPWYSAQCAIGYANLGQFDSASTNITEALQVVCSTNENLFKAEIHRIAGDIALKSPQPDLGKAEAYFERALAVARQQQAKSWELRAAMSLARLWRDQGKVQQARELLAPVYGWFTEGFDTLDLKEAKALLEELSS